MKKGVILLNGEPYLSPLPTDSVWTLCADGAYNWANGKIEIDENVGDFDSVETTPVPRPKKKYPTKKNKTDGEICMDKMLRRYKKGEVDFVELYGGGGRRDDHFFGNLALLSKAHKRGLFAVMKNNGADVFLKNTDFSIRGQKGKTLSLFPFEKSVHIIDCKGLLYPCKDVVLKKDSTLFVSNVLTSDEAEIRLNGGTAIVFISDKQ